MSHPLSIYHAFDMRYDDVVKILDRIKEDGYSHIQLSPSQKSRTTIPKSAPKGATENEWWYRYQPLEFVIGNYYGTKDELELLTRQAHDRGLKVLSDVCLNFVAELEGVSGKDWDEAEKDEELYQSYLDKLDKAYPPFKLADFKPRYKHTGKGKFRQWYMGNLPGLDMESEKVQLVHFTYLQELVDAGIDGFRFDCAQWMNSKTMSDYFHAVPTEWSYLEVIERRKMWKIMRYHKIGPISDYHLGQFLSNIFSRKNNNWIQDIDQLPDEILDGAVTFAVNHDTYHSKQSRLSLRFDDNNDRSTEVLATALLLVTKEGIPLVFRETAKNKLISEGMQFRKLMHEMDAPEITVHTTTFLGKNGRIRENRNVVFIARGHHGFCLLNRSRSHIKVYSTKSPFPNGEYYQVGNPEKIVRISGNRILDLETIKPKSCQFFVCTVTAKNDPPVEEVKKDRPLFGLADFPPLGSS